ncbi:ornithine aminomutase subunit alpha [Clostridiaceae bacterium M8S5]|nr:ornithine aminomutase subunit alpha [Clostridiaceae bacterium M8S5]
MSRADDFQTRRAHLKDLTEAQLEERFWKLAEQIIDPIIELAEKSTSPSIERSILLRMGFSSIEAKELVNKVIDKGLMGKGAGHVIYKAAKLNNLSVRDAGLRLMKDELWETVEKAFDGGAK